MAKQEIWIRVQDDLQEAHSLFCSLIDSGGKVCVDIDSYGRLFQKLKDIRERKTIQAEFYDLPDDEKQDRALKMMSVLKGLNLYTDKGSGETAGGDVDVSYLCIADEWDKELQEWERVYSGLISDVAMFVVMYCNTGGNVAAVGGIDINEISKKVVAIFKPTFKKNGKPDKNAKEVAKEYFDEVRGCSLKVCAEVYNRDYGETGKAITGTEWGRKKSLLYEFLVNQIGVIEDIEKRTFTNNLA